MVIDDEGRHGHQVVLPGNLPNRDGHGGHRARAGRQQLSAVMFDAITAVQFVGPIEPVDDGCHTRRSEHLQACSAAADPGGEVDVRQAGNVIGVKVGQKDAAQPARGQAGLSDPQR